MVPFRRDSRSNQWAWRADARSGGRATPLKRQKWSRRELLEACITRGLLVGAVSTISRGRLLAEWQRAEADARQPTSEDVLGPFYKKNAPDVRVLRQPGDRGFPLRVSGTVHGARGGILPNATIDVWQADVNGHYDLAGYRYRAKVRPSGDATYWIETIMPGHYGDRPVQHIHYLVSAPGHKTLVTQAYFATDPFFGGDPDANYAKDGMVQHRELVRPVTLFEENGRGRAAITFDIVLEPA